MPLGEEPEPQSRKRKRSIEHAPVADPQPQPQAKRRKRSQRPRSRTPPEFWDNLSRVPLCRRALREFDRRTVRPVAPKLPERSVLKGDLVKQLKRFARHGGPNLRDIRGYPEQKTQARMSQSQIWSRADASNASSQSTRRTTISSKDPAFEQALIDADYYPHGYEYSDDEDTPIPNNIEELIEERLGQPRPSLSPSHFTNGDFRNFQKENMKAKTEDRVRSDVFPIIRGRTIIPSGQNEKFNHLTPLARNISDAQPDYYNGSRPAQLHPDVRRDLGPYIIPCTDTSRPLLPNFFTELKGPDGKASEMKRQVTQDLGNGARGMHKLQSYKQKNPTYDGNAYTVGATYHSGTGTLQMYAMHPTEPAQPGSDPQYHTTQMTAFAMTADANTFRRGVAAFRNARDWAKEQRDEFIARANERADEKEEVSSTDEPFLTSFTASSQNELTSNTTHQDSGSSTDGLARDTDLPRKRRAKSRQSGRQKRTTASSSTQESTAVESWTFAKGRFHCFRGETKVGSQKDCPRDVWVYNKDGWSNGGGKLWCSWESDGTPDYC